MRHGEAILRNDRGRSARSHAYRTHASQIPWAMFATTFLGHQGWMFRTDKARACSSIRCCARSSATSTRSTYRVFPPRVWTPRRSRRSTRVRPHPRARRSLRHPVAREARPPDPDLPVGALVDRGARRSSRRWASPCTRWCPASASRFGDLEVTAVRRRPRRRQLRRRVGHAALSHPQHRGPRQLLLDGRHHDHPARTSSGPRRRRCAPAWSAGPTTRSTGATWPTTCASASRARSSASSTMGIGHKLVTHAVGHARRDDDLRRRLRFHGDKAWLNERVFCVDTEAVVPDDGQASTRRRSSSPACPGQTFVMQGDKLKRGRGRARRSSRAAPRDDLAVARPAAPAMPPTTRRRPAAASSPTASSTRLAPGSTELAGSLVGGPLFRSLCSLLATECGDRAPTFAFVAARRRATATCSSTRRPRCGFVPRHADAPDAAPTSPASSAGRATCSRCSTARSARSR